MRLGLSTAAAPDLALVELLDACARRGLAALELVAGDRHGVGPELDHEEVLDVAASAAARGITIAAYRAGGLWEAAAPETVRLAFGLGAPVIVKLDPAEDDRAAVLNAARRYAAVGAQLLLEHASTSTEVEELRKLVEELPPGTLGLAWEADPSTGALDLAAPAVLDAAGSALRYVRLRGGGPEAMGQEGQGIGALMARLTLAGYQGTLALAPSTSRYLYAWGAWLGRGTGGWGCGSKTADDSLVRLNVG
jgi:sugar phosphate isomerase/epimerase